ncbi:hypothetical protein CDAR_89911 [Caerostris darwini]|uniref:Uncharacterized protein n=1 Tax=Caerostris darwini TaxID=1538125 RepID=A0AAV4RHU1_9ARAC|nr:hypothetical protein CDAR_89911 [Caerostris darwini]
MREKKRPIPIITFFILCNHSVVSEDNSKFSVTLCLMSGEVCSLCGQFSHLPFIMVMNSFQSVHLEIRTTQGSIIAPPLINPNLLPSIYHCSPLQQCDGHSSSLESRPSVIGKDPSDYPFLWHLVIGDPNLHRIRSSSGHLTSQIGGVMANAFAVKRTFILTGVLKRLRVKHWQTFKSSE